MGKKKLIFKITCPLHAPAPAGARELTTAEWKAIAETPGEEQAEIGYEMPAPASQGDAPPRNTYLELCQILFPREQGKWLPISGDAVLAEARKLMAELNSLRSERGGQDDAKELSDLLCPPHANLDKRNHLEPFDNCIACIRVERDELRKLLLRISTDIGQTIIEDPIKSAEGWVMMSKPVLADIAAVFEMPSIVPEPPTPPASGLPHESSPEIDNSETCDECGEIIANATLYYQGKKYHIRCAPASGKGGE